MAHILWSVCFIETTLKSAEEATLALNTGNRVNICYSCARAMQSVIFVTSGAPLVLIPRPLATRQPRVCAEAAARGFFPASKFVPHPRARVTAVLVGSPILPERQPTPACRHQQFKSSSMTSSPHGGRGSMRCAARGGNAGGETALSN